MKKMPLLLLLLTTLLRTNAQIEAEYLSAKGYQSAGMGYVFPWGVPLNLHTSINFEAGIQIFDHAISSPVGVVAWRYFFSRHHHGFYLEGATAFAAGVANIPRQDSAAHPLLRDQNGNFRQPDLSGPAFIFSGGYVFANRLHWDLGFRCEHVIGMNNDVNIYSLRISPALVFGREHDR